MLIAAHYVTIVTACSSHGAIAAAGAHCALLCGLKRAALLLHGREVGDFNGLVRGAHASPLANTHLRAALLTLTAPANN